MGYEGVRGSGLRAGEVLDNSGKSGIVVADNNTTAQAPISQSYVDALHSGGSKITIDRSSYHNLNDLAETYCHEGGHYIDFNLPGTRNVKGWRYSEQQQWQSAMAKDLQTSGKKSWREYGENSPLEDFTDSIAFDTFAHAQFVAAFPERSKLLANLLK